MERGLILWRKYQQKLVKDREKASVESDWRQDPDSCCSHLACLEVGVANIENSIKVPLTLWDTNHIIPSNMIKLKDKYKWGYETIHALLVGM